MMRCLLPTFLLSFLLGCGDDGSSAQDAAPTGIDAAPAIDAAPSSVDASAADAMPQPCFVGDVSNDNPPTSAGPGILSVWSYQGQIGTTAGNDMCQAIGADHVCSYAEVLVADGRGELAQTFGETDTFWLHRVNTSVPIDSTSSPPGAGGRCNDWTYPGNATADGEYAEMGAGGVVSYHFDSNTCYTGNALDGCAEVGLPCAGVMRAIACCSTACGL